MKLKKIVNTVLCSSFLFMACSKYDADSPDEGAGPGTITIDSAGIVSGTAEGSAETGADAGDLVENSTFSNAVSINFGSSVTISNPLSGSGVSITIDGADVVVRSTVKEVEYIVSGVTTNGSLKIYSDNKFKLTLNGAGITNADGPAINIQSSKTAFIVLADNTTNTLTDGAAYAAAVSGEDMKSTLFSEGQLVFSGNGSLTVKGNYKHAIASDDYIRVRSGIITVTGAVSDGIHTNDAFIADGGTLAITAASDGIECEEGYVIINDGTFTLNTGDDGIAASYEDTAVSITPYVNINGGKISINSSGGEGIESKSVLTINNGYIVAITADDGLNAGSAIYINGGSVYAKSSGNDAMDSNGSFTVTGGKVVAIGAGAPEGGIDCDGSTLKISGGILVGIGGTTSAPNASASTAPSVIMGSGTAGRIIHIESTGGAEALTFSVPNSYSTMLFGSSKLKSNTTYAIYTGGSIASGTEFHGLYTSGTYSRGTSGTTFTTSSMITKLGGTVMNR